MADSLDDLRKAIEQLEKQNQRLLQQRKRQDELDRCGLPSDFYDDDDDDTLDPSHHFYEGEQHDVRATDGGWKEFLEAHKELVGFSCRPGVGVFGDAYPLRWYYRHHSDRVDRETLYDALARAFERNARKPVTHLQIGQALWGPDAAPVDSAKFGGVLYHAAKRGEVLRFSDEKPVTFAPNSTRGGGDVG